MSSEITIFLWAFVGSIAVELEDLDSRMQDPYEINRLHRYYYPGYLMVRTGIAMIAGLLAIAAGVEHPIVAAGIGASSRFVIKRLGEQGKGIFGK
jgi:hypothetical protein